MHNKSSKSSLLRLIMDVSVKNKGFMSFTIHRKIVDASWALKNLSLASLISTKLIKRELLICTCPWLQ